jgi:hypothetical protein
VLDGEGGEDGIHDQGPRDLTFLHQGPQDVPMTLARLEDPSNSSQR